MSRRPGSSLIALVIFIAGAFVPPQRSYQLQAQTNPPVPVVSQIRSTDTLAERQLVKVTISTSRPEVTRNHGWGLTADIKNISKQPITIFSDEVQLVMQPEATLNTQCDKAFGAFLPNTTIDASAKDYSSLGSDVKVVIQPGEHYMLFWTGVDMNRSPEPASKDPKVKENTTIDSCRLGFWGGLAETLNFIPGPYVFAVTGKFHTDASQDDYHTFAEAVSVKLGIEQLTIMLFAGIGAILAYFVIALRESGDVDKVRTTTGKSRAVALLAFGRNILSAFLLGAVLAVVANRLSDTQFPVKVSVNDVWGALTVGFVFYFIGQKLIDKLSGLAPAANNSPPPAPKNDV
jgi:hypothetical protein